MSHEAQFRTVVAIDAEAAPIRERFLMRDAGLSGLYPVFRNETGDHWLVVAGIGRVNGGAAVAYLSQVSQAPPWTVWLNVGIAGHPTGPQGSVYLAHQIIERATGKRYYPGMTFRSPSPTAVLTTVDKPEFNYCEDTLYDMEAAGIFDVARRLSSQELIQTLKVVSDTPEHPLRRFRGAEIKAWVGDAMDIFSELIACMTPLSASEALRLGQPLHLEESLKTHRFTVSQTRQLRALLVRWAVLCSQQDPVAVLAGQKTAKSGLRALRAVLDETPIHWRTR